jgi:hypothetical protein
MVPRSASICAASSTLSLMLTVIRCPLGVIFPLMKPSIHGYRVPGILTGMGDTNQTQAGLWQASCRVYWGSHGCDLERGHKDDCECGNHPGSDPCCVGKAPYYGPQTRFYGEDVTARGLRAVEDDRV